MENFKEAINRIKRSINSVLRHAGEFFKAFSEPAEQEQPLKEAAIAAGMTSDEIDALTKTMDGVNYEFDNGEQEAKKSRKQPNVTPVEHQVQPVQRTVKDGDNKGIDR